MKKLSAFLTVFWILSGVQAFGEEKLYSNAGRETAVAFQHVYQSRHTSLSQVAGLSAADRKALVQSELIPLMAYLFGPLVRTSAGSPKGDDQVSVNWAGAFLKNGKVFLPYSYSARWIVRKEVVAQPTISVPVPYNEDGIFTPGWKLCTDSDPEHQTDYFYWYFWDPRRPGCDQTQGVQFDYVTATFGAQTVNLARTYPEYGRLLRVVDGKKRLNMTFGFGYVNDPANPNPTTDNDPGAYEFRKFLRSVRAQFPAASVTSIKQKEYRFATTPELVMGQRFVGKVGDVTVTVNVVMAANIDQMEIFAKSYAHDHDGAFAWLGHSRVGSAFDAERFQQLLAGDPGYFSLETGYQLIYWGGCNSYSYYVDPFFELRARSFPEDAHGAKNLDILANGLPSLFSLNATNSSIVLDSLLNWQRKDSYQTIVDRLEKAARTQGVWVMSVIMGDEDNPQNPEDVPVDVVN